VTDTLASRSLRDEWTKIINDVFMVPYIRNGVRSDDLT